MSRNLSEGLEYSNLDLSANGMKRLAEDEYTYLFFRAYEDEMLNFDDLSSFVIYIVDTDDGASVKINSMNLTLSSGDCVQVENARISINIEGGAVQFLLVGVKDVKSEECFVKLTKSKNMYKVTKPWGYELWINGEHPQYVLKQICIKAGNRTSLQYHRFKRETIVLFSGEAKLHYKNNEKVSNDDVSDKDVSTHIIKPTTSIDISQNALHRMEAVDDIVFYEASTPYLDDVIRVQDDKNRLDGRISDEHKN